MVLVQNLDNKNKYVLNYKNLQRISVQRILKFKQSDWLKKHIDSNTDKRKMLSITSDNIFLNWWIMVYIAKKWKI